MDSKTVRESLGKFSDSLSFNYPAFGWYFSPEEIENSFHFKDKKWLCMFKHVMMITEGKRICFSVDHGKACTGLVRYFGYKELKNDGGIFLSEVERFKKNRKLAEAYTKEVSTYIHPPKEEYLYIEKIENIEDCRDIEVVNLFPADPTNLAKLVTLSSYDRKTSIDNVLCPDISGCQSLFTIPHNEQFQDNPRGTIGLMDTLARKFIPEDMISFSLPANRFVEMANHIEKSFLCNSLQKPL